MLKGTRNRESEPTRGGRIRPPLGLIGGFHIRRVCCAAIIIAAAASFVWHSALAQTPAELRRERRAAERRQSAVPPAVMRPRQAMARNLMRKMLKPTQQYVGVQKTMLYEEGANMRTSEQDIKGDTNGFVQITFRSPPGVAGDVMIIGPNNFHSYHRATNTVEVATWPTEWNDESNRMFANLLNGSVNAWMSGTEIIAGRSAAIVAIYVPSGGNGPGQPLRKLWIDEQAGILLKIQKFNAAGQTTSTTTMQSVSVNPAVPISPNEFKPNFSNAIVTPLFPPQSQYRTIQEAQGHLPFTPLEPQTLPANFRLDGVWAFGADRAHPYLQSVLMRYTDGVANFSLYERIVPAAKQGPILKPLRQMFMRNQENWRIMTPQGLEMNVQYIGHLAAQQTQAMYETLR